MRSFTAYFFSISLFFLTQISFGQSSDQKAQNVVDKAIEVHGGDLFKQVKVSFGFRGKSHTVDQDEKGYIYDRTFEEDGDRIRDVLDNGVFKRFVNGVDSEKSERQLSRAFEDVNAVSYFALLPYKLNDQAVLKAYIGEVEIKGVLYHKIKVTFAGEGSGDSPDNVFYYWFNVETGFMDYLAYDKGGNRFRAAYNQRVINGIRFADYINYSGGTSASTSIDAYDKLYDADKLKELSRIVLDDVVVEKKH
ncbi:DUF6503 family protein [Roseivirga sp.]|uniref:DUF6503 family protein n=1 Tax=Roseivirga sp. TaxID=1964215 RepID=UPI003B8CB927